jgi:hypothetical protein
MLHRRDLLKALTTVTFAPAFARGDALQPWQVARERMATTIRATLGGDPSHIPVPGPLDFRTEEPADELGTCTRQLCSYLGSDGERVGAYLMLPKKLAMGTPAVLCVPVTHNSTNHGMKEPVGLTASRGSNGGWHYAKELTELGFPTLTVDFGAYDEWSDQAKPDPFDYAKAGYCFTEAFTIRCDRWLRSIRVLRRAVDVLEALPHAPRRIGAIGLSAGGYGSLWHAAFDQRIAVCVSACGVTHWHLYAAAHTPQDLAGFRGLIPRLPLDPNMVPFPYEDVIKLVAPRPLFLHCPLQDNIQPGDTSDLPAVQAYLTAHGLSPTANHVQATIEAAREIYASVFNIGDKVVAKYPPGPHDFAPAARAAAYAFLDQHL